jgi:hypothetical protein
LSYYLLLFPLSLRLLTSIVPKCISSHLCIQ